MNTLTLTKPFSIPFWGNAKDSKTTNRDFNSRVFSISVYNLDSPIISKYSYSSNNVSKYLDKYIDTIIEQSISNKLIVLEKTIGKELFDSLDYSDKIFMARTFSSIDFGHAVDLERISQEIKNDGF